MKKLSYLILKIFECLWTKKLRKPTKLTSSAQYFESFNKNAQSWTSDIIFSLTSSCGVVMINFAKISQFDSLTISFCTHLLWLLTRPSKIVSDCFNSSIDGLFFITSRIIEMIWTVSGRFWLKKDSGNSGNCWWF